MINRIMLLIMLIFSVLLCSGCIEDTNANNSSETEISSNSEGLPNIVIIETNESSVNDNTLDVDSTIYADTVEDYDIAAANNAFGFDIYSIINNNDENVCFSPYSIFTAMAICYDGSEGSTKDQISNVFYYPLSKPVLEGSSKEMIDTINSNNGAYDLKTANALWVREDYPLNEQYTSTVKNYYGGMITPLDFAGQPGESRLIINSWVENKTNNKIKNLLAEGCFDGPAKLIITNAVYFNGTWLQEFKEADTRKRVFRLSDGQEKKVDTMYAIGTYSYGKDENAQILELPYRGDDISMYIILPSENNIEDFENEFTSNYYNALKNKLNSYEVKILLPKFTFKARAELNGPLQDMGIVDAFDSSDVADFSGISDTSGLSITEVVHQAYISVDEKGTEAAAATEIASYDSLPYYKYEFTADHPFMFFIEDKRTGCILFMGKVESPEYEEMS
ncbi:serpin family protein [Methanolobus psychrotolerans]|uniref:serpin family protein n=1 Tax=Methanolobus psychrotolerans TaxID=1874706 RepID=UPI000B91CD70|nr:serpin family protein [Methanolobus psychrotolerans]